MLSRTKGQFLGGTLPVTFICMSLPARSMSPFLRELRSHPGPRAIRRVTTRSGSVPLQLHLQGCLEPGAWGTLPSAAPRAIGGALSLGEGNVLLLDFYCLRICWVFLLASGTLIQHTVIKPFNINKSINKQTFNQLFEMKLGERCLKTAWIHNSIGCFSSLLFFFFF